MTTWIVGGIVLIAVAAALWKIIRDKKKGKGCCGSCDKCSGCH